MLANIAPVARRSAAVTAVAAIVMVAISAAVGGHKGAIAAGIAVGVVAGFFGLSVLALSRAAKISAPAMMLAGMGTYIVKIIARPVLPQACLRSSVGMTTGPRRGRSSSPDQQPKPYQPASPYQPPTSATPDQSQSQDRPQQQQTAREADGWRILSYMLGGMLLYGGIGWLVSRWTGIAVLFPVGMIFGIGLSIALIIFRFTRS